MLKGSTREWYTGNDSFVMYELSYEKSVLTDKFDNNNISVENGEEADHLKRGQNRGVAAHSWMDKFTRSTTTLHSRVTEFWYHIQTFSTVGFLSYDSSIQHVVHMSL